MARYDDDFDDLPRRGRRAPPARSGLVTAVGVLGIVLGSLGLLYGASAGGFGLCCFGCQGFAAEAAKNGDQDAAQMAAELGRLPLWWAIAGGGLYAFWGLCLLFGGVGTLRRAGWGRVVVLLMAALGVLLGMVDTGVWFAADLDEPEPQLVLHVFVAVLHVAFAAFAYVALIGPWSAGEFDR